MINDAADGTPTIVTASAGSGRYRVDGTAIATGAGVVITLAGGERPHVGAAGVGIPRPSLQDPQRLSATSSVVTITGHRDDELAKPLATLAAARLNQPAVVVVGVHVDAATAQDIDLLSSSVRQVAESLISRLLASSGGQQSGAGNGHA